MRIILLYILLALLGQQTTFLETENLKISKSEKVLKIFRVFNFSDSQIQKDSQIFSFSDSQIQYYESQIRLADSLYKNYLPQYNFDEVKAAMMFFDSCEQRAMSNETFLESENLKTSESEKGLRANDKGLKSESRKDAKSQSDCLYDSATLRPYDPATAYRMSVDCCPLTVDIEYQRARAHYYHAVGLTERDDIVGACEHYFIALEIMESETENLKTSKSEKRLKISQFFSFSDSQILNNPEDYEKFRFLSLIYTRLGELFLSENYCDLAISKYRKALRYKLLLGENKAVANTYKCLGNSYQLYNMPDSALYYYNKSLATNSEPPNRLDVEKCIAQILFDKGEKDSAYVMIRNNLDLIEDYIPKYAYYATLGDMFYGDMKYDSAIYFLGKSVLSNNVYTKYMSSTELSAIYDSLDNQEMMSYYDSMASELSNSIINSSVDKNSLLTVYNAYKERMHEKEMLRKQRKIKQFYVILASVLILSVVAIVLIRYRDKRKEKEISEAYSESKKNITDKEEEINKINKRIRHMESEMDKYNRIKEKEIKSYLDEIKSLETEISQIRSNLENLKFTNSLTEGRIRRINAELRKKEELIDMYKHEISVLKNRLEIMNSSDVDGTGLELYLRSKVCSRILDEINELSAKNRNTNELTPLTQEEFVMLLKSAIHYIDKFADMVSKYRALKKDDLYYLSLAMIGLKDRQISSLFGVTYNATKTRRNKICSILGVKQDELKIFLLNICT